MSRPPMRLAQRSERQIAAAVLKNLPKSLAQGVGNLLTTARRQHSAACGQPADERDSPDSPATAT